MKFCKVGIHDWVYTHSVVEYQDGESKVREFDSYRECSDCGKKQKQESHLLGLNPEKYIDDFIESEIKDK